MVREPDREREEHQGGRARPGRGKHGATGDEQIVDTVHATVSIDDALRGMIAHPGRPDVVTHPSHVGRPPGRVIDLQLEPAEAGASQLDANDLHGPVA